MRPLLPLALLGLVGCHAVGQFLENISQEHPAAPLQQFDVTSDARIDPSGWLRGSFVGEGTSRAVHLLSSDTGFIASLVERYRPDAIRGGDLWGSLARAGIVTIDAGRIGALASDPSAGRILMVGSPDGHSDVQLAAVVVHGSSCGWRGAQAELIVEPPPGSGVPAMRGPVTGSFRLSYEGGGGRIPRDAPPDPSSALVDGLIARTASAMDSSLSARLSPGEIPLQMLPGTRPLVNTLLDVDAADVLPIRVQGGLRYAVSLRERRVTARGDTVLAATVMVWDSIGTWRQFVFEPTLLDLRRNRLHPRANWAPVYWRRLQPLSAFEYRRDYLWMEQVAPRDGSVFWGVLDPRGNVMVAAAEVDGPCH